MSRLVVLACLALSGWAAMAGAEGTGPYVDGMTFVSMLLGTTIPRKYLGLHHWTSDMHTCIHPALPPSCHSSLQHCALSHCRSLPASKRNLVLHNHPAHSALTSALWPSCCR